MKKELLTITILCLAVLLGINLNSPTKTLNTAEYTTRYIERGDSLWTIASDITPNEIDVRDTIEEIKKINEIKDVTALVPGTKLKVPAINDVQNRNTFGFDMAQN